MVRTNLRMRVCESGCYFLFSDYVCCCHMWFGAFAHFSKPHHTHTHTNCHSVCACVGLRECKCMCVCACVCACIRVYMYVYVCKYVFYSSSGGIYWYVCARVVCVDVWVCASHTLLPQSYSARRSRAWQRHGQQSPTLLWCW